MYQALGIHWASSVPAFSTLACVPFPFLFYKFGARIRTKCKFAAQVAEYLGAISSAQSSAGVSDGQRESHGDRQQLGSCTEDETVVEGRTTTEEMTRPGKIS